MSSISQITNNSVRIDYTHPDNSNPIFIRVRLTTLNGSRDHDKTYYTSAGSLAKIITGLQSGTTYIVRLEKKIHSSYHQYMTEDIEFTTIADSIPATLEIQDKTTSKIVCLITGDPKVTYAMNLEGDRIIDNISTGDVVTIDRLVSNTTYTLSLL